MLLTLQQAPVIKCHCHITTSLLNKCHCHITTSLLNKCHCHITTSLLSKCHCHITTSLLNKCHCHITTSLLNKCHCHITTSLLNKCHGHITTSLLNKCHCQSHIAGSPQTVTMRLACLTAVTLAGVQAVNRCVTRSCPTVTTSVRPSATPPCWPRYRRRSVSHFLVTSSSLLAASYCAQGSC